MSQFKKSKDKIIKFRVRTKLILAFVFIITVPIIFLGTKSIIDLKEAIRKQVIAGNKEIANIVAQELNSFVENTQKILNSTTRVFKLSSTDSNEEYLRMDTDKEKKEIFSVLSTTLTNFDMFEMIAIVDVSGRKGLVVENNGGLREEFKLSETRDEVKQIISKYWYSSLIKGKTSDEGKISDVYFDLRKHPRMFITMFIRNSLKNIVGVLMAEINLDEVSKVVNRIKIGESGTAFIADNEGKIIANGNGEKFVGENHIEYPAIKAVLSGNGTNEGNGEYKNLIGKNVISTYVPFKKFYGNKYKKFNTVNWGVIVEQETDEAFASADSMMKKVIVLTLVGIICVILLGIYIANSITKPLHELVIGAQRISEGDLTRELKATTRDEVGELAYNFDQMRLNMQKKIEELRILYEVGKDISSVLEYKKLLEKILDKSMKVMDAEKGSLMLIDEETGMLHIGAARGLPDKVVKNVKVPKNKGIVGWVIKTAKPLLVYDTKTDNTFRELKGKNIEGGTMLSVPLKAKDKILGVINVSKSIPNTFDKKDLELFEALANQAAIAIDNATLYRMAITDGLTKLYIHRYYQQRLDEEIKRSKRYNDSLSLVMLDIDHFKKFNDTYGHQTGDEVLKVVARILEQSVRNIDIVARYGGEEFSVILPEKSKEEAMIPAERMRTSIQDYEFMVDGKRVPITISLGISEYPVDTSDKMELIAKADTALYFAKDNGRNCSMTYKDDMGDKSEK